MEFNKDTYRYVTISNLTSRKTNGHASTAKRIWTSINEKCNTTCAHACATKEKEKHTMARTGGKGN